ncbi:hypothetical protein D3C81_1953860 [compost metagenome]
MQIRLHEELIIVKRSVRWLIARYTSKQYVHSVILTGLKKKIAKVYCKYGDKIVLLMEHICLKMIQHGKH